MRISYTVVMLLRIITRFASSFVRQAQRMARKLQWQVSATTSRAELLRFSDSLPQLCHLSLLLLTVGIQLLFKVVCERSVEAFEVLCAFLKLVLEILVAFLEG